MTASHRTQQGTPWPGEENEGSGWEKDGETDQRAHVNRANIRSGQDEKRFKRFLYTCPLQEKGLLFGLYSERYHPLPHRHTGKNLIDQMGRHRRHALTVARGANTAPLARVSNQKITATMIAVRTGEAMREKCHTRETYAGPVRYSEEQDCFPARLRCNGPARFPGAPEQPDTQPYVLVVCVDRLSPAGWPLGHDCLNIMATSVSSHFLNSL